MSIDLAIAQPLNATPQFISDQANNPSPLAIGTGPKVGIGTTAPETVLTVFGNSGTAPLATLHSKDNEASIRFINDSDQIGWHVGSGGNGGKGNLFFFSSSNGVVATLSPTGVLTVSGLKVNVSNTATASNAKRLVALMHDPQTGEIFAQE